MGEAGGRVPGQGMSLRGLLFDCVLRLACPGLVLDLQRLRRGKGLRS